VQRYTRTKLRRGSGSVEERELSEKLRAMRMSSAEQEANAAGPGPAV
jgi:hypothetical protein